MYVFIVSYFVYLPVIGFPSSFFCWNHENTRALGVQNPQCNKSKQKKSGTLNGLKLSSATV